MRFLLTGLFSLTLCSFVWGQEPPELKAARSTYTASTAAETQRQQYILKLAHLREHFAQKNDTPAWQAVDAEINKHPAPVDSDGKALTKLRLGKWRSPRHDYLYRADGTWIMLPVEEDATGGKWSIQGNKSTEWDHGDNKRIYTILLLTPDNFIFTDGTTVFYEKRLSK